MSQRDDVVPVRHMLEHAREALSLISGRTREELHAHRITHGYDVVDYDILWDTVQDDFPPLVAALEPVLADLA